MTKKADLPWPPSRADLDKLMEASVGLSSAKLARRFGVSEGDLTQLILWYERHGRIIPNWLGVNPFSLSDEQVDRLCAEPPPLPAASAVELPAPGPAMEDDLSWDGDDEDPLDEDDDDLLDEEFDEDPSPYLKDQATRPYDPKSGLTKLEYALAKLEARVTMKRDFYTLDGRPASVWDILKAAGFDGPGGSGSRSR